MKKWCKRIGIGLVICLAVMWGARVVNDAVTDNLADKELFSCIDIRTDEDYVIVTQDNNTVLYSQEKDGQDISRLTAYLRKLGYDVEVEANESGREIIATHHSTHYGLYEISTRYFLTIPYSTPTESPITMWGGGHFDTPYGTNCYDVHWSSKRDGSPEPPPAPEVRATGEKTATSAEQAPCP